MAFRSFCSFELGDFYFGVEVERVQEVIPGLPMTQVPLADRTIRGLINLRGNIVTAIDLRHRIGLPERPADREPMNIIVTTKTGLMSLLVDEIGDVIECDQQAFEPIPGTITASARQLIRGAYKLPTRLLLEIDSDAASTFEREKNTSL